MGKTTRQEGLEYTIRPMTEADIDTVAVLEKEVFPTPWSRDAFIKEVTENALAHYYVADADGTVIGYAGMWLIWDGGDVTNVAVLAEYRGYGVGTSLVKRMADDAAATGAQTLMLEVRRSNENAQRVYASLGFRACGVRKGYYEDNREDAILMELALVPTDDAEGGQVEWKKKES